MDGAEPPRADALDDIVAAGRGGVLVNVHVQPRAGRPGIVGRHGTAVRVRVKAPPVGGRANDEAGALLAAAFGVAPSAVTLVAGPTSRVKRFLVTGVDAQRARERLALAFRTPRA